MTLRTTRANVTFKRPFHLDGFGEAFPAGEYSIETNDEMVPDVSFPAYRRVATSIRRVTPASLPVLLRTAVPDPLDLAAALINDRSAGSDAPIDKPPRVMPYGHFPDAHNQP
jgi:hypothetical protein